MFNRNHYTKLKLAHIYDKVINNQRLNYKDGLDLFHCSDFTAIGYLANLVKTKKHNLNCYYTLNRHINYTNVCVNNCLFCAFKRSADNQDSYLLSKSEIRERIKPDKANNKKTNSNILKSINFSEIHIVGGCYPNLHISYYQNLLEEVKNIYPDILIKAFTPVEIAHIAKSNNLTTLKTLEILKKSGLNMLPGGGAEIFNQKLRQQICPTKISGKEWLKISEQAHSLNIPTNATMLFGHLENYEQRLTHLLCLRKQQDISKGFTCFIPLPYLTANNKLILPDFEINNNQHETNYIYSSTSKNNSNNLTRKLNHLGIDKLKTIAISRLLLDNFEHIKAYRVMLGIDLAQLALHFGADDFDGTIKEENIGKEAGANFDKTLTETDLIHLIENSGFKPILRDTHFNYVNNPLTNYSDNYSDAESKRIQKNRKTNENKAKTRKSITVQNQISLPEKLNSQTDKELLTSIIDKVKSYQRLSFSEALLLYEQGTLYELMSLAHLQRLKLHPDNYVTYIATCNINYTNICTTACEFCAFYTNQNSDKAYVLSHQEFSSKIEHAIENGVNFILLQGGHNPSLNLNYFKDLLSWIKNTYPKIHIHAFSPPEIVFMAKQNNLSIETIISELKKSGLDSIPGGGAEILSDRVRQIVSPEKASSQEWLEVMVKAHQADLRTSATMMFGQLENKEERLEHLFKIREVQDNSLKNNKKGFTAFIPWAFQPNNTKLQEYKVESAVNYLRLLAISRLVLDNIINIQTSWITMGPEIAQIALYAGANDFGSFLIEENVLAAAGVKYRLSKKQLYKIIKLAGFMPIERSITYTHI